MPDWELNSQPSGAWDDAPTNWPTWPEQKLLFFKNFVSTTNITDSE